MLLKYAPIFDTITVEECLKNSWISPFKIVNIPIPLKEEDRKIYNRKDKAFKKVAIKVAEEGFVLDVAKEWSSHPDKKKAATSAVIYGLIGARRKICINNENKIDAIVTIIEHFCDRKILIFSESIVFAEKVSEAIGSKCVAYHNKLKKKEKEDVKEGFTSGRYMILSSVKGLNAGFDVPDISLGIIAAGNSTVLTNIQRNGRIVRYVDGKKAIIVNLYSENTVEETWMEKRQRANSNITNCSVQELLNKYSKTI